MSIEYWSILETPITAISGATLSGLANNASVLSSAISNIQGAGSGSCDGGTLVRVTLSYQFSTAPTANTGVNVWLLKNTDGQTGTAYEEGSSSVTPTRQPDLVFQVATDTNAHVTSKDTIMPAGYAKVLIDNAGTGQSFGTTTANLGLTLTPITYQGV